MYTVLISQNVNTTNYKKKKLLLLIYLYLHIYYIHTYIITYNYLNNLIFLIKLVYLTALNKINFIII